MGEEDKIAERIEMLQPYKINERCSRRRAEPTPFSCTACPHSIIENGDREKVSEDVRGHGRSFRGPRSRVFDEAENRVHTIKAVMVATLVGE